MNFYHRCTEVNVIIDFFLQQSRLFYSSCVLSRFFLAKVMDPRHEKFTVKNLAYALFYNRNVHCVA